MEPRHGRVKNARPWTASRNLAAMRGSLSLAALIGSLLCGDLAAQGRHWAHVAPERPPVPTPKGVAWVRNPIDAFVLERLEREHLATSPEADRRTLLRRVSLDLTGLPPTPEELARFCADPAADAYEREVDRLLASPRYGERMARPWLDLARYADTNGYEKDLPRSLWPWRDWVIDALNRDLPYDTFTVWQLAGDLLPEPTLEQRVATGFHRNTMLNDEGGVDAEEFRIAAVVDRVNTTATVWLGSTLACAQCHDHKHDPFSQRDYYAMFAFFDHTADSGVGMAPTLPVPTPELSAELAAVTSALQAYQVELDPARRDAVQEDWERQQLALPVRPIDGTLKLDPARPQEPAFERNDAFSYGGFVKRDPGGCVIGKIDDQSAYRGFDLFVNAGRIEVHVVHHWPDDAIKVETQDLLPEKEWHHVLATYDGQAKASGIQIWVDGTPWPIKIVQDSLRSTIASTVPWKVGQRSTTGRFQGELEDVQVFSRVLVREEIRSLASAHLRRILGRPAASWSEVERKEVRAAYVSTSAQLRAVRDPAEAARQRQKKLTIPTTMVMAEGPATRPTRILKRGNFLAPGDVVEPDVPKALPRLDPALPRNRLGLARWLASPENPLAARVAVNRAWLLLFGAGLVRTPEDFGTKGDAPTHRELLDWLATEFVRLKWSQKALHRLIVTSATYRQASTCAPAVRERDPENVLLARAPRPRLEAEQVRDQALAIAGLLVHRIGGPSVMPNQPAGTWSDSFANHDTPDLHWVEAAGDDRFRRGLYTYWRRSAAYPASLVFDAPRRDVCVVARSRSNTPLQALVLLNDPVYREAALGLAVRMAREGGIARGFELATARVPGAEELAPLEALRLETRRRLAATPDLVRQIVAQPHVSGAGVDPALVAELFPIANVLLNLDEVLTRG